jgi:hypothetical protein
MKKRTVVQIEGGLGKQVALTALLPYFKERYEEVIVLSSFPDVFEANPNIYRNISYTTPFAYEEYIKNTDDIFFICGYRDSDFRKRRIHLLQAACNSIGIEHNNDMAPKIYLTKTEEKIVKEAKTQLGSYIIIQCHGAGGVNTPLQPNIMARDYEVERMEKVVNSIKEIFPTLTIINYSLPGETEIKGTVKMNFNNRIWFGLVRECETFIAIDSSLQHISAAFNKKGIVLWGATNPSCFGWKHNINLVGKCSFSDLHCTRPYFVPSVDIKVTGASWECQTKECMNFEPEQIIEEFKKITIKTERKPVSDLTNYVSSITYQK